MTVETFGRYASVSPAGGRYLLCLMSPRVKRKGAVRNNIFPSDRSSLGLWVLAFFVPLFGLGFGGLVVLWPLAVGHDFGLCSFGTIAGVLGTVTLSLGGALGPVVTGAIYDSTGSYHWAFLLCTGILLMGAGVAVAATEPLRQSRNQLLPGSETTEDLLEKRR
jgi:MFS family permease